MIPILTLLTVLAISLVVTRIAAVAFVQTGLSPEVARLQAVSGFTGTGFTTDESEMVARHPVRRRILTVLMVLGNAGLVTAVSTLILGFIDRDAASGLRHLGVLAAGLVALVAAARSKTIERWLYHWIEWCIRRFTDLDVSDYVSLLHIAEDYMVTEVAVEPTMWIADKPLADLQLPHRGIIVLGVMRASGTYDGIPTGHTVLHPGDMIVLYGRGERVRKVLSRTSQQPFKDLTHAPFSSQGKDDQTEGAKGEASAEERIDC